MLMSSQVKRERETRSMQLMSGVPWETVTLTTLSRDRTLFPELLSEARDLAMSGHEGKLVINTAWGIEWKPFGQPRQKRPLHSVVLQPGVCERVEHDIKSFLQRRKWYADRGQCLQVSIVHLQLSLHRQLRNRHSISSRLPIIWPSGVRENLIHSSISWVTLI